MASPYPVALTAGFDRKSKPADGSRRLVKPMQQTCGSCKEVFKRRISPGLRWISPGGVRVSYICKVQLCCNTLTEACSQHEHHVLFLSQSYLFLIVLPMCYSKEPLLIHQVLLKTGIGIPVTPRFTCTGIRL